MGGLTAIGISRPSFAAVNVTLLAAGKLSRISVSRDSNSMQAIFVAQRTTRMKALRVYGNAIGNAAPLVKRMRR